MAACFSACVAPQRPPSEAPRAKPQAHEIRLDDLSLPFITNDGTTYVAAYLSVDEFAKEPARHFGGLGIAPQQIVKIVATLKATAHRLVDEFVPLEPIDERLRTRPAWAVLGSGVYPTSDGQVILLGVGVQTEISSREQAIRSAKEQADAELHSVISTLAASAAKDFLHR